MKIPIAERARDYHHHLDAAAVYLNSTIVHPSASTLINAGTTTGTGDDDERQGVVAGASGWYGDDDGAY